MFTTEDMVRASAVWHNVLDELPGTGTLCVVIAIPFDKVTRKFGSPLVLVTTFLHDWCDLQPQWGKQITHWMPVPPFPAIAPPVVL